MNRKLDTLEYSYWEHFKYAKDLTLILPVKHPKRIMLNKELDSMINQINKLKKL